MLGNTAKARCGLVLLLGALVVGPSFADGTVAEQRLRLPPAVECGESDVAGIWRAKVWRDDGIWHEFTVDIRHVEGRESELEGTIKSEFWTGGREATEPGPCAGEQIHLRVSMNAVGSYRDGQVRFGGVDLKTDQVICGEDDGDYLIDHFSGTIDRERQEFQSTNNDGGAMVDVPVVFRRIACHEPEPPGADVEIRVPRFLPERRTGGCR